VRVFLAGIIQGSLVAARIHDQDWRGPITDAIRAARGDADIYCHYSRHPDSITYDLPEIRETFADGLARAAACDLLVAYLPSASMGTGVEMHVAAESGAAVVAVTPLAANWVVRVYADRILPDVEAFASFCADGGLDELLAAKRREPQP
jgi:hypothetical protein